MGANSLSPICQFAVSYRERWSELCECILGSSVLERCCRRQETFCAPLQNKRPSSQAHCHRVHLSESRRRSHNTTWLMQRSGTKAVLVALAVRPPGKRLVTLLNRTSRNGWNSRIRRHSLEISCIGLLPHLDRRLEWTVQDNSPCALLNCEGGFDSL